MFAYSYRKNEEIDDKAMIKRLRTRVAELEAENSILKHGPSLDSPQNLDDNEKLSLTNEDKNFCQNVVNDFLKGKLLDPVLAGLSSFLTVFTIVFSGFPNYKPN